MGWHPEVIGFDLCRNWGVSLILSKMLLCHRLECVTVGWAEGTGSTFPTEEKEKGRCKCWTQPSKGGVTEKMEAGYQSCWTKKQEAVVTKCRVGNSSCRKEILHRRLSQTQVYLKHCRVSVHRDSESFKAAWSALKLALPWVGGGSGDLEMPPNQNFPDVPGCTCPCSHLQYFTRTWSLSSSQDPVKNSE